MILLEKAFRCIFAKGMAALHTIRRTEGGRIRRCRIAIEEVSHNGVFWWFLESANQSRGKRVRKGTNNNTSYQTCSASEFDQEFLSLATTMHLWQRFVPQPRPPEKTKKV